MDATYLTTADLARRWRMSERTLEGYRRRRIGPEYIRVENRAVRYELAAIEAYEREHNKVPRENEIEPEDGAGAL